MLEAPRFHLDESMPHAVADGLHSRDRECSTSQGEGLNGVSDPEQLDHCREQGKVLITRDFDFAELADDPNHAGIIIWVQKRDLGQLIKDVDKLCFTMSAADFQGQLIYL